MSLGGGEEGRKVLSRAEQASVNKRVRAHGPPLSVSPRLPLGRSKTDAPVAFVCAARGHRRDAQGGAALVDQGQEGRRRRRRGLCVSRLARTCASLPLFSLFPACEHAADAMSTPADLHRGGAPAQGARGDPPVRPGRRARPAAQDVRRLAPLSCPLASSSSPTDRRAPSSRAATTSSCRAGARTGCPRARRATRSAGERASCSAPSLFSPQQQRRNAVSGNNMDVNARLSRARGREF